MTFSKKVDVPRYDRITARRASTSGAISAGWVTSADCKAVWAIEVGGCAMSSGRNSSRSEPTAENENLLFNE